MRLGFRPSAVAGCTRIAGAGGSCDAPNHPAPGRLSGLASRALRRRIRYSSVRMAKVRGPQPRSFRQLLPLVALDTQRSRDGQAVNIRVLRTERTRKTDGLTGRSAVLRLFVGGASVVCRHWNGGIRSCDASLDTQI